MHIYTGWLPGIWAGLDWSGLAVEGPGCESFPLLDEELISHDGSQRFCVEIDFDAKLKLIPHYQ